MAWVLCFPVRLVLALFGQRIYNRLMAFTFVSGWLSLLFCGLVGGLLPAPTSLSERLSWAYNGVTPAIAAAGLLVAYDAPVRPLGTAAPASPDMAALEELRRKVLKLWKTWDSDPCLKHLCYVMSFVEKALRGALAPAVAPLPGGGTGAPAATALGGGTTVAAAPGAERPRFPHSAALLD